MRIITLILIAIPLFFSCKKEEIKLQFEDVELTVHENYIIPNGKGIKWVVADTAIATVSGDIIQTKRCGFTSVSSIDKAAYSFYLKVLPVTLFDQPCTKWGCSKSEVKKFMSTHKLIEEEDYYLIYDSKYKEINTVYIFENDSLIHCKIFCDRRKVTWDEYVDFFSAYYNCESTNDDIIYFTSDDKKTTIATELSTLENVPIMIVHFIPADISIL